MYENVKVVAMDLDGTLTQHKTPMSASCRATLERLAQRYHLLMAGAGQAMRIFEQMGRFPVDVVANYGMQCALYDPATRSLRIVRDEKRPCDREAVLDTVGALRRRFGYTSFAGESVEFHPSGCLTFPLLGTKAAQEDKLAFDPDRTKRRAIYDEVVRAFPSYCVFVGGSSSFDMAPKPFNKYYALDRYCREHGLRHDEVAYFGDDYGTGGNDEAVYQSDFPFITVDHYEDFPARAQLLLH